MYAGFKNEYLSPVLPFLREYASRIRVISGLSTSRGIEWLLLEASAHLGLHARDPLLNPWSLSWRTARKASLFLDVSKPFREQFPYQLTTKLVNPKRELHNLAV